MECPPKSAYDDFTDLAALICGTPIALVSLIDDGQQRLKSNHGLDVEHACRVIRFCEHTIARPGKLTVVPDASVDERFTDEAVAIEGKQICFYAGRGEARRVE